MNLEYDLELRTALFQHIAALRRAGGGVVTSRALNERLQFRGERIPIWNYQRGIFRPEKLRTPGAALSIQTAYRGPYDDRWDPADERLAYRYQGTDPHHNDNRALRRALALQLPLLYLVGLKPGVFEPVFPCYVVDDDPDRLTFYLVVSQELPVARQADSPTAEWPLKRYITQQVKKRLHQDRFRFQVIGAYAEQCAMCRLRHVSLLEAAHIIEDRAEHGLPEVPNGLALCGIHHRAFDVGILGVDPECRIHLRRDVLEEEDGPMLRHGLQELHATRLFLPRRTADRPNPDYLAERFAQFRAR